MVIEYIYTIFVLKYFIENKKLFKRFKNKYINKILLVLGLVSRPSSIKYTLWAVFYFP